MAFLTTSNNSGSNQRIRIDLPKTVLGRHPDCEVVIEDSSVSRRHAQIVMSDGQYILEDLQSRNGTALNNKTIHQATRLLDGDAIRICDASFVFRSEDIVPPPSKTGEIAGPEEMSSITMEDDDDGLSSIMSQIELPTHSSAVLVSPERKLDALMDITRALSTSIKLEEVLPRVLDCLFDLFVDADRGFLLLADDDGNPRPLAMKIRNPNDDEKIRVSRTVVRHVMKNKQALISSDAAADDRFDLSQSITDFRIRSIMCAPLIDSEQNSMGVIQLDTLRRSVAFSEEDLELLLTVAIQAGIAIENAKAHQRALKNEEQKRDLELANEVQHRLLPNKRPKVAGYTFADYYRPANSVGGDYYDYIQLDENRIAIIVADVVGHGIAAALLMAKLSSEMRFALLTNKTASDAIKDLNSVIEGLNLDRFVTMVLALLNISENQLTVVNAGHMQPLVRRANGEIFEPSEELSDVPIGILDSPDFPEYNIDIGDGEIVFMYTDGLNEAMDHDGKQFGIERVVDQLKRVTKTDPESVINSVKVDLKNHMGDEPPFDDICMVCFGRISAESEPAAG